MGAWSGSSRCVMSEEEILTSGWIKEWVDSLPDITAAEMHQTMADIAAACPGKSCDIRPECRSDVSWAARFHDCAFLTICEDHAEGVMATVMEAISLGGFRCEKCQQTFNQQAMAVKMWRV